VHRESEKDKGASENADAEADYRDVEAEKSQREATDDDSVNKSYSCCPSDGEDERTDCDEPS